VLTRATSEWDKQTPTMLTYFSAALLALASLVMCASPVSANESTTQRLNVVLIVADDLGWSDLGCYGADLLETPSIDKLASGAIRFTDAYAASVCTPTRACLLTGKHYARLHMTVWREVALDPPRDRKLVPPVAVANLPQSEQTLADVFHSAGYLTALVGKWHLGDAAHYPETCGFDFNIGGTLWGAPESYFFPYRGEGLWGKEPRYVPHLEDGRPGEYLTDRLTDEALKLFDGAGDRPFFLYLAHHAPHIPVQPKAELVDHYDKKMKPGLHHRSPKYAAMVQSLDESVGRVLDRLERRGLADRTVVVFVSDNGGYIGNFDKVPVTNNFPLRSGKGSLYEGGIRVPLIIRCPNAPTARGVCHEPVYVADLFPTLLEIAGLQADAKNELDGQSLMPLLKDPSASLKRDALYFHFPHYYETTTPVSAIRAGDWKLLEYLEDHRLELYNLRDDLRESKNLADVKAEKVGDLRSRLAKWRTDVQVQMPTVNPNFHSKR
jgi:arylsulfatase A